MDGTVARKLFDNPAFTQLPFLFTSGSTLYFSGTTFDNGTELWKTDGTTAGTVLVKDINPGPESSAPQQAVKVGTKYYFIANDGIHGFELWSTEGTGATTVLVKDVNPGTESSNITELTAVGSTLFFANVDGLWKSNGTDESTVRILENTNGRQENLTNVSGKLFFTSHAGPELGKELWKSDGTILGTAMIKDIQPGPLSSNPDDLKNLGGRLYFSAFTNTHGIELWSSNGTAAGTILEKDINPGVLNSSPQSMFLLEDQIMLFATDPNAGRELLAEPKSIIGPTGEGESPLSEQIDLVPPVAKVRTHTNFDQALLAWNDSDTLDSNRRSLRYVFPRQRHSVP